MYDPDPEYQQDEPSLEDIKLETLFRGFQPRPTERFYRRMASAPWKVIPLSHRGRFLPSWRRLATAALAILLVVAGYMAFPQLSVMARQMMSFFLPKSSDRMTLQVTIPPSGDTHDYSSEGYFSLTPAEAAALARYTVKELPPGVTDLIPSLEFTGAHFDPDLKAVTLRYSAGSQNLYLSEHPTAGIEEYATIGPSALVEQVTVAGVMGEYVTGGWKLEREVATPSSKGTQVSMDIQWDPSLPRMTLRWSKDGILYEIISSAFIRSDRKIEKEDLIRVAELIK